MVHDIVHVNGPTELYTLKQNFMLYVFSSTKRLQTSPPTPKLHKALRMGLILSKHSVNVNTFSAVIIFLIVTRCLTVFRHLTSDGF